MRADGAGRTRPRTLEVARLLGLALLALGAGAACRSARRAEPEVAPEPVAEEDAATENAATEGAAEPGADDEAGDGEAVADDGPVQEEPPHEEPAEATEIVEGAPAVLPVHVQPRLGVIDGPPVPPFAAGAAGAASADGPAADRALRGFVRSRYRFRSTSDEDDHDLETQLVLDVAGRGKSPLSAHIDLWTNADLDEDGSSSEPDPFFDLTDTYDSSLTARLYQAYVDVDADEELDLLRVGRQPLDETPEFVTFDGLRVETGDLGADAWRVGFYGGIPAHFYESSPEGDLVLGTFVEARPWEGGRARLDYMHLEDDDLLGEHRNDLLAASAWHSSGRLRLVGEYSMLEGESRDFAARANWYDPEEDLLLQGSWYQLLETQRDLVTELDPFYEAMLEYFPFYRAHVLAAKGFAERYRVELGTELRQLVDESDEGAFNHEYVRTHGQIEVDRIAGLPLIAALTGELWDSDDGGFTSWGADLTREWDERLRTSLGSYFALYDFDLFTLDEREDVRVYYLDVRYELSRSTRLELVYEYEDDELDEYHVLRGGILWRF